MANFFSNMLSSFLHPDDPYKKAQEAAASGYNKAAGYETPYIQQGQEQYGRLNQAAGALMNPAELENQWAQSYQESPYAKQMLDLNKQQGLEAASSMGLMGSSAAMGNIQQGAGNIVNQDRQQFLNDLMQKYMAGIGLGQSMYGTGAAAAGALSEQAAREGETQAGLAYGRSAAPGQLFGQLLGAGANIGANYFLPGIGNIWNPGTSNPKAA